MLVILLPFLFLLPYFSSFFLLFLFLFILLFLFLFSFLILFSFLFQVTCLKRVLVDGGHAFIVAPSRHGTFEKFSELLRIDGSFEVEQSDKYSDKILKIRRELNNDPRFDENLQFPKLLKLRKLKKIEN